MALCLVVAIGPSIHHCIFPSFPTSEFSRPVLGLSLTPPYPANDGFTSIVFVDISLRSLVNAKQAELGTPHRHHYHHHRSFTTFAPMALSRGNQHLDGISDEHPRYRLAYTEHRTFHSHGCRSVRFAGFNIDPFSALLSHAYYVKIMHD